MRSAPYPELDRSIDTDKSTFERESPLSCLAIVPKIELELELAPLFFRGKELLCSRGMHLAGQVGLPLALCFSEGAV
jgi:hypothetical protein